MATPAKQLDSKESLTEDLYRARRELSEYRAAVKAKQTPEMQVFEAYLELNLRVVERGLARLK
jgi:hypothetical protein